MLVDAAYSTVTHQIIGQYELSQAKLRYAVQRTIPILYKGICRRDQVD